MIGASLAVETAVCDTFATERLDAVDKIVRAAALGVRQDVHYHRCREHIRPPSASSDRSLSIEANRFEQPEPSTTNVLKRDREGHSLPSSGAGGAATQRERAETGGYDLPRLRRGFRWGRRHGRGSKRVFQEASSPGSPD
jgi:hypothetical protein